MYFMRVPSQEAQSYRTLWLLSRTLSWDFFQPAPSSVVAEVGVVAPARLEPTADCCMKMKTGAFLSEDFPSTTVWFDRLLPARGQDDLHLLRPLIDGLIADEAGLLAICALLPSTGYEKLSGQEHYRVRQGDYRVFAEALFFLYTHR